jgi:hypothetical protein
MKANMTIEQTTYTNLRENLAPHLRKILKNNTVLEVIWRSHKPCIVMSKERYNQLIKNDLSTGHVNVDEPLNGHGQIEVSSLKNLHGDKKVEKQPNSSLIETQHDLFPL